MHWLILQNVLLEVFYKISLFTYAFQIVHEVKYNFIFRISQIIVFSMYVYRFCRKKRKKTKKCKSSSCLPLSTIMFLYKSRLSAHLYLDFYMNKICKAFTKRKVKMCVCLKRLLYIYWFTIE